MKKVSKQHLVVKRNTLKTLTGLPSTDYRHVVGGCNPSQGPKCPSNEQTQGSEGNYHAS